MLNISDKGPVRCVELDRPARRNAMTHEMVVRLIEVFADANSEDGVRAVFLSGAGKGFCAGSDLSGLAEMQPGARAGFEAASGRLARMIGQCRKPVIAGVHGFAVGGGLTLAAACDVVVSHPDAKWSLPEVPVGLFPAWGMGAVIQRAGVAVARQLAWGVDVLDAADAHRLGLVDLVADDVQAAAMSLAGRLSDLPRRQSEAVKRYFSHFASDEYADLHAVDIFMEMTETPEARATLRKYGGGES